MTSALVLTQWIKDEIDENHDWASFDRATGSFSPGGAPAPWTKQMTHSEAFQAGIWHCLVSHPSLMTKEKKWEGLVPGKAADK